MSTATQKAKMSSRHVLLIITGIMLTFGCSLVFDVDEQSRCRRPWAWLPPLARSIGSLRAHITVLYLTMTVVSPMAGKLIQKMDIHIILSVSAALVGIAFILLAFTRDLAVLHSGVLLGLGEISILWLAIPFADRWFRRAPVSSSMSAWL
ncbi:MAG: hypothetical protein ACLT98_17975 [Eggerthellaceae bacterium]